MRALKIVGFTLIVAILKLVDSDGCMLGCLINNQHFIHHIYDGCNHNVRKVWGKNV